MIGEYYPQKAAPSCEGALRYLAILVHLNVESNEAFRGGWGNLECWIVGFRVSKNTDILNPKVSLVAICIGKPLLAWDHDEPLTPSPKSAVRSVLP